MPDSQFSKTIRDQGLKGFEQLVTDFNQVKSLEAPSHSLLVSPDGTVNPALIVDNSGNVGINTESPASRLHVIGNTELGDATDAGTLIINGPEGSSKTIRFQTEDVNRWILRADSAAESGGNVGSDFELIRRNDAGGSLGESVFIQRSTGYIGLNIAAPAAQLHIDQSDTGAAVPVITLDQANLSEEYINFISATTGAGDPVDTATAVGTVYARVRVAVNGTFKYIQLYNA